MDEQSCSAKGCVWSTGKMNTPDHDFCSVIDVTNDPAPLLTCPSFTDTDSCSAQPKCKWYTVAPE
jgi:hypothetical protein